MTDHIQFDQEAMELRLLDQRQLPLQRKTYICSSSEDVVYAIKNMVVRGAPAIGVTAAYGCLLSINEVNTSSDWRKLLADKLNDIRSARPTAVNLAWAVDRMSALALNHHTPDAVQAAWLAEALAIHKQDIEICLRIGTAGAKLIADGDTVLTHCNAGALATAGHGTALGVIRSAVAESKKINVIVDETRPWLQGARLTAWELEEEGIPYRIACDNACAHLMSSGLVQLVITGADRIAANGDTANKIGTLGVAVMARHFGIPFYIAAPLSTIDLNTESGKKIRIEERNEDEVLELAGQRIAPAGARAWNFAFDVTPAELISGIITEKGILLPPYQPALTATLAGHLA